MSKYVGVFQAAAPITHGAPTPKNLPRLPQQESGGAKNHMFMRELPVMTIDEDQKIAFNRTVYCVSGNSIKHLLRQLIVGFSLNHLGISPGSLDPDIDLLFWVGGVQESGKGQGADYEVLEERKLLRQRLPWVDLLGGVYMGHFFPGKLKTHFMFPLIKDLRWLQWDVQWYLEEKNLSWDNLPTLAELKATVRDNPICYTRTVPEPVMDIDMGLKEKKKGNGEDEEETVRMIYSADALPIGTLLCHTFALTEPTESADRCLRAGLALLAEYGYIGGQTAKGHGWVIGEYRDTQGKAVNSTEEYAEWLRDNAAEIKAYISEMPRRMAKTKKEYERLSGKEPRVRKKKEEKKEEKEA